MNKIIFSEHQRRQIEANPNVALVSNRAVSNLWWKRKHRSSANFRQRTVGITLWAFEIDY